MGALVLSAGQAMRRRHHHVRALLNLAHCLGCCRRQLRGVHTALVQTPGRVTPLLQGGVGSEDWEGEFTTLKHHGVHAPTCRLSPITLSRMLAPSSTDGANMVGSTAWTCRGLAAWWCMAPSPLPAHTHKGYI